MHVMSAFTRSIVDIEYHCDSLYVLLLFFDILLLLPPFLFICFPFVSFYFLLVFLFFSSFSFFSLLFLFLLFVSLAGQSLAGTFTADTGDNIEQDAIRKEKEK